MQMMGELPDDECGPGQPEEVNLHAPSRGPAGVSRLYRSGATACVGCPSPCQTVNIPRLKRLSPNTPRVIGVVTDDAPERVSDKSDAVMQSPATKIAA
jgi:hypothetical protein